MYARVDYSEFSAAQEAAFRAEDVAMVKRIEEENNSRKLENAYHDLLDLLDFIAKKNGGLYLADEGIDDENVMEGSDLVRGSAKYWLAMNSAARMAAGDRAEAAGLDLNKAAGKIIY